ncbi:biotin--[acetyl-CoA-carboxylase] ligase [Oleiharenicola lentus]|uniref:Bifunctional ligase/repressor BirA n=1 Tax=Oleiharenicola lentus TaxID=2508720 RepID=A0A4Q1CA79_9BACT|nr:biotin--[acetyl-CoA-carboxylase] ligase [Oleiharenicola lentus]RXK55776.1 biotin--[acetyl-CoA-carboxylase] ligase [Oleiharenicola lentus]
MAPTEVSILRELLVSDTGYVSGNKLAKQLGLSRVAVWMQLQKLTKQGFEFEAARSRGYRLLKSPPQLHHALIQAHLASRAKPPTIITLEQVDSTNSEASRQLASGSRTPLVILAREQTQGRGRRGRVWHSPPAGNLYSTFVFRPKLEPARLQDFTLWMGLNVCELIANFCAVEPGMKWPNDVYFNGRKAGGMLTEARIDADEVHDLVFGLGLNLNARSTDLPKDLQKSAISLSEAAGSPLDVNRFAAALIGRVLTACNRFFEGDYRDKFAELWQRFDVLRGQPVSVTQGDRSVAGTATGIDDEGSLIVRTTAGRTERFRAGEVTLSRDAVPAA